MLEASDYDCLDTVSPFLGALLIVGVVTVTAPP